MTTRCAHAEWTTVRVRESARVVVLACTACGKRRNRDLVPCPDCHHLSYADRMRCETCPYSGYVLAAEAPPSCCCWGMVAPPSYGDGPVPCEGCAVAMGAGMKMLYHMCDVPTPEEEERADEWAVAGPVARSQTSRRARDISAGMER